MEGRRNGKMKGWWVKKERNERREGGAERVDKTEYQSTVFTDSQYSTQTKHSVVVPVITSYFAGIVISRLSIL